MVISNSLDVFGICETWLRHDNNTSLSLLRDLLPRHRITTLSHPRRGGGLAVITSAGLKIVKNKSPCYVSFEHLDLTLSASKNSFRMISVYHPPSSSKNKSPISKFILEFSDLIERIFTLNVKIVLAGDFNVHVDIPSDSEAFLFNDILTTFNLQQHVKGPSHRCSHTLDLVITRERDNNTLSQTKVFSATSSDLSYISC